MARTMCRLMPHWAWMIVLVSVILGAIAVSLGLHRVPRLTPPNPIPFDAAKWAALRVPPDSINLRLSMLPDLLRSHRLVGMTREAVEELLGPMFGGDFQGYFIGRLPEEPSLYGGGSLFLYVFFSAEDRVCGYWYPFGEAGTIPAAFRDK